MPHLPAVSISGSYFGALARSGFIFPIFACGFLCAGSSLACYFGSRRPQYHLPSSPSQCLSFPLSFIEVCYCFQLEGLSGQEAILAQSPEPSVVRMELCGGKTVNVAAVRFVSL